MKATCPFLLLGSFVLFLIVPPTQQLSSFFGQILKVKTWWEFSRLALPISQSELSLAEVAELRELSL